LFRSAIACAQQSHAPVFERRCLLSFQQFLASLGRYDPSVDSRLGELSHLDNLSERVAGAMRPKAARL
jgi:hypothetical protein